MNASYWTSPTGQHVLALERLLLADHIRRFHGDTVLWAGTHSPSAICLSRCMVRNPVFLDLNGNSPVAPAAQETKALQPGAQGLHEAAAEVAGASPSPEPGGQLNAPAGEGGETAADEPLANRCVGELENLPFKSGSVDGVLLHHGLEFASDPRTALREITRVLAPGGRLILVGFNPLSLFGVRSLYSRLAGDGLSGHSLINPLRLFDWLALLDFQLPEKPLYSGHGLPFVGLSEKIDLRREEAAAPMKKPWAWARSNLLPPRGPFGGLLIVNALKQSAAGNLQWRTPARGRRLAPVTYPRVAAWDCADLDESKS